MAYAMASLTAVGNPFFLWWLVIEENTLFATGIMRGSRLFAIARPDERTMPG